MTILAKFVNGHVEGSRYEAFGGLKGRNPSDKPRWRNQDWVAMIDMLDLNKFTWPEASASSETRNLCN